MSKDQKTMNEQLEELKAWQKERQVKFPIQVDAIECVGEFAPPVRQKGIFYEGSGHWVAVRPCAEEHRGKTFLGFLIGYIPIRQYVTYDQETKTIKVSVGGDNPAIFVPELKKVIMGYESWWGKIKDENHLRQISDDDINNVWYVQALKAMQEQGETDGE